MFKVNQTEFPLERLVKSRSRVTSQLTVRNHRGKSSKLPCEFQTHADFVFSAAIGKFSLDERVDVRVATLQGMQWQTCLVTFVEDHSGYSLYQLSVLKRLPGKVSQRHQA